MTPGSLKPLTVAALVVKVPRAVGLIPKRFNPLETLNSAKRITTTPAVLKNNLAVPPLTTEVKPPTPKRPGAVPIAKTPIVSAPETILPVLIAYNCMAWVKPQGKKKVKAPRVAAFLLLYSNSELSLIPISSYRLLGSVNDTFFKIGKIS